MSTVPKESESGVVVTEQQTTLKDPPHFAVVLHNDDYTPMDFVVTILKRFFHRKEEEAVQIMLQVHQQGKGTAGIYHSEIAETKVMQVHEFARAKGFPLLCSTEPLA